MADKPAKRRVKNPETFRERAIKANNEPEQASTGNLRKAAAPVGQGARKVAESSAVKPFRRPLRLVGRILFPKYFRNSWQELKLVKWPSWPQSRRLTFAVLVFATIFGLSIAGLDYILENLFKKVLLN